MARCCNPAKEQCWRQVLARKRASGPSVRAYCEAHGLSEQNSYRWQRVLAQRQGNAAAGAPATRPKSMRRPKPAVPPPLFVPIDLDVAAARSSALEVVLSDGRVIRVRPGFDPATFDQLVACLEGCSC